MESEIVKTLIGNAPAVIGVALWLSARLSRVEAEVAIIRSHFGLPAPPRRRRSLPMLLLAGLVGWTWIGWLGWKAGG